MLAAAVSTACARSHAPTVGAELVLGAAIRAGFLTGGDRHPTPYGESDDSQNSLEECPAMTESDPLFGEEIEPVRIHRLP